MGKENERKWESFMKNDVGHMRFLADVSDYDINILIEKEGKYKGSWKKRGGIGAFMMLARKWDRIENQLKEVDWDVFLLCQRDRKFRESEIGDLRRYLMLVEAELQNLEKIYPDVRAKLEVKDEFSPKLEKILDGPIIQRWKEEEVVRSMTVQCQECGEYYTGTHTCKGKCRCCSLFENECFCSCHEGECKSQFVNKEEGNKGDPKGIDPRI